jgi:hypothetical protein
MEILKDRPPYVVFEHRPVEDRNASIEAGHYVAKDVVFALITPQGSRDRIEQRADDWFVMLEKEVSDARFPAEWLKAYKGVYKDWLEGRETPTSGTSIKLWPILRPSLVNTLLDINLRTVEDVANANEESVGRIGMGGRLLKQQAIDWLAAASSVGVVSEQLASLRADNAALVEQNNKLSEEVKALLAKLTTPTKQAEVSRKI